MFPIINLGPLSLPSPAIILLLGFWLGSYLTERFAKSIKIDPGVLEKVLWTSMFAGLIGARLSFVARFPTAFQGDWSSLISLNPAFLDPFGGLVIAIAIAFMVLSKQDLSIMVYFDGLTPFFGTMILAFFLSQFSSGSGHGILAEIPWGIYLWGGIRHPVQLYFAFGSIVLLTVIMTVQSIKLYPPGYVFLLFITVSAGFGLFFSYFQVTNFPTFKGLRVDQILIWMLFIAGIYYLNKVFSSHIEGLNESNK